MKLDILAIGVHPDDVELCCAGTLLKHIELGKRVGILDLSRGELGTRGSGELRLKEAREAADIMGIAIRENLGYADGFFVNDKEHQMGIIEIIRKYRPDIVLANAVRDRHPDHGRAAALISEACFYAGLLKIETGGNGHLQERWRPRAVYHYVQDRYIQPDLIVDVSDHYEQKMKAIMAYASQFYQPGSKEPSSPISSKSFLEFVTARMRDYGRLIGTEYAEGFTVERPVGIHDLTTLL